MVYCTDIAVCSQLDDLQRAPFELYLRNPFRMASIARTDAGLDELRDAFARLEQPGTEEEIADRPRLLVERRTADDADPVGKAFRRDLVPHLLTGDREAMLQELASNPLRRLMSEMFWIWPRGPEDAAVGLMQAGDVAAAKAAWNDALRSGTPRDQGIAGHNLAVLAHFDGLNCYIQVHDDGDALTGDKTFDAGREALSTCMDEALGLWRTALGHDAFWQAVSERGAQLGAGVVTPERVAALRTALGPWLTELTLRMAFEFATQGTRRRADSCGTGDSRGEREIAYAQDLARAAARQPYSKDEAWAKVLLEERDALANAIVDVQTKAATVKHEPAKFDWVSFGAAAARLRAMALLTQDTPALRTRFLGPVGKPLYYLSTWFRTNGNPPWPVPQKEPVVLAILALPNIEEYSKQIWQDSLGRAGDPPRSEHVEPDLRLARGCNMQKSPKERVRKPPLQDPEKPELKPEPFDALSSETHALTPAVEELLGKDRALLLAGLGHGAGSVQQRVRDLRERVVALREPNSAAGARHLLARLVDGLVPVAADAIRADDVDLAYGALEFAGELAGGNALGSDVSAGRIEQAVATKKSDLARSLAAKPFCFFCNKIAGNPLKHVTVTMAAPSGPSPALPVPPVFKIVVARCADCEFKHHFGWCLSYIAALYALGWLYEQSVVPAVCAAVFLWCFSHQLTAGFFGIWGIFTAPRDGKDRTQTRDYPPCRQLHTRGWSLRWPY